MDTSTTTTTDHNDNGVYHPLVDTPTPVMLLPTTIPTPIKILMESENKQIIQPINDIELIDSSSSLNGNSFTSTKPHEAATVPTSSGTASTTGTGKTKTNSYNIHNKDLRNMEQQESLSMNYERSNVRDGLTGLAVILFVLGLVGFIGFLSSRRFRKWREGRTYDSKRWQISRPFYYQKEEEEEEEEESFNPATRQLSIGTTTNNNNNNLTIIPKQFTRGWSVPVEQIDEERGWLWGTTTYNNSQSHDEKEIVQSVTPGLGIGKYRSKKYSTKNNGSRSTGPRDTVRLSEPEGFFKEVFLEEPENHHHHHHQQQQQQQQQNSLDMTDLSTPHVSYLLTRLNLKQSLTAKSRFNIIDSQQNNYLPSSSSSHDIDDDDDDDDESPDSQRCMFNQVGQLISSGVKQEDISNSALIMDKEEEKKSSSSKTQIELPELPPLAWDTLQTNKTKRTIDLIHPTTSSSITSSSSKLRRSENSIKFNHYTSSSNKTRRQRKNAGFSSGFNSNSHHQFIVKSKKKVTSCNFV